MMASAEEEADENVGVVMMVRSVLRGERRF
jgi:hypothetical protein